MDGRPSQDYAPDDMSTRCLSIFERGRYFIQTGTPNAFGTFWSHHRHGIARYIPSFVVRRVQDLIAKEEREAAVTLWMHACVSADAAPWRLARHSVLWALRLLTFGMALYAFIAVLR